MYGCYNRAPFKAFISNQDGWHEKFDHDAQAFTRIPNIKAIPFINSQDCQFSKHRDDAKCGDCKWKKESK